MEEKEAEVVEKGREREVLERELESLRAVVIEVSGKNSGLPVSLRTWEALLNSPFLKLRITAQSSSL